MMINVGVYLNDGKNVHSWEANIINELSNKENINVIIINNELELESSFSKNKLSLLPFQLKLERAIINDKPIKVIDKIESVFLKDADFDYIINLNKNVFRDVLIKKTKVGVFEVFKNNGLINTLSLLCVNEIVKRSESINLKLKFYYKKNLAGSFIEDLHYTYEWKGLKNIESLSLRVSAFLIKNINKSVINCFTLNKDDDLYTKASLSSQLQYIFNFYFQSIKSVYLTFLYKFFNQKKDNWTLAFGEGLNKNLDFKSVKTLNLPKDEFWADPFLFKYKEEYYVFFEKYINKIGRGIISCGKLINGEVINVEDVLITDYHMSYPNIFEEDGEIYMIPEISEKKRLEIYRCVEFPNEWELYSSAFEGEYVVDTIYYKDKNNKKWLFLSKTVHESNDNCSELYIYSIDSLKLNEVISHKQNPIFADCKNSRNGGAIFELGNDLIRPSQNNSYGVYGFSINFNKINTLNLNEYKEEKIINLSDSFKKYKRVHHFNSVDELFVFDCYLN